VPVVTMNMGGMAELIQDGVTGVLVDQVDPDALTDAIRALMSDSEKCREMSRNCFAQRDEMITIDRYCRQLESIYAEVRRG